jgi:DNA primase catalytic core
MEITEIKARLSIHTVLKHYNLTPDRNGMLRCPFHADDTASLKVYPNTNTFNCFGCGKNGDQIEFCTLKEGSKHKGILRAKELLNIAEIPISGVISGVMATEPAGITGKPEKPESTQEMLTPGERTGILTKIFEGFKNGLHHPVSVKPKEYLKGRNLDYTKLEYGYNSGQFHHRGSLSEADKQACISVGLLLPYFGKTPNDNGTAYTAFAKDCIIFPLKDKQNRIVSIYGRSIINNDKSKHYYLKDRAGLYPNYPKPDTTKLILTEAIIDAATLLQIQITSEELQVFEILACYGTNGLTEEHKAAIKELTCLEEIIFFFDGDKAGTEAVKKYQEEFSNELPEIKLSSIETPEGEDVNSLSVAYDAEIFIHLLENRKDFFLLAEKIETKESVPLPEPPGAEGKLNTRNPESAESSLPIPLKVNFTNEQFITFTTSDLQIIILGGINLQQLDRLRVTLKISRTDTNDPLHSVRHTLDLYHSDYLEKFINKASEQLETGTNVLKRALAELTGQIEQYRLSRIESQKEKRPQERKLSEQSQRRAIKYLSSPKLMERTNSDIGRTGMIGEENNRLLMYLVFTSRLREQPLHIISLGASGTGKTYLQEKVSELIPEHHKLEITILSENAFYYFGQQELKHKLILIEDMDGAENVLYPLRELQSKMKISKTIPIKDSRGNLKTITLKVEGPICLAGTTTKERLYEDNANRSLLIYLDSSKQHKEHIMNYQRKLSAGKIATTEEKQLIEFFKDMQTILKPVKVRNPFAEYLIIPEHVFKPLRANSHYLAFIETVTFYHQYQREVKTDPATGERYIETTLEDIEWANLLLKDILLAKADELPGAVRDFLERLKRWLQTNGKEIFYSKEIREEFRIPSSSCNRYIMELLRNNYIKITGGNKYRQGFEYQVVKFNEYKELQQNIKTALDEALENIKKQCTGIPTVSQNTNGILKTNNTKVLSAVSR